METKEKLSNLVEEVAEKITADMEKGVMPWDKPWFFVPSVNGSSSHIYQGMNLILLGYKRQQENYSSPAWMTFLQAKTLGGTVKKGEKGTEIIYFEIKSKTTEERDEQGKKLSKTFPFIRLHYVFNLDQIEGLDHLKEKFTGNQVKNVDEADQIIKNSGAAILFDQVKDKAFYSPATDRITLPFKEAFKTTEGYYGTLFHELTQNAESRIMPNRFQSARFSSENENFIRHKTRELVSA